LWHISHEGGLLENPWNEPEETMYQISTSPESAPDQPAYVEIEFESGTPIAINGEKMSPASIIILLNKIGGAHGIGRVDMVENRLVGMKSHGVYETPGGTILLAAHRELESLVLDRQTMNFKDVVALKYADLVYDGLWFTPLREALDAFVDSTQGPVTGVVKLKLFKGNIIVAGKKSKFSLYREDFATFGQEDVYDQSDAEGFIHLYGLPLKVRALNQLPVSGMNMPKPDYSRFKRD
jgi:argininosuccinate synthase